MIQKILITLLQKIKQNWKVLLLIVGVVVLLLSIRECSKWKQVAEQRNVDITKFDNFDIKINKQGQQIALQQQLIVDKDSKLKILIDSNQFLKNIKQQVKVKTVTNIDTLKVPIEHPVYVNCDSTSQKYLKVPSLFRKDERWFKIKGGITDSGYVLFDSVKIFNEPVIQVGNKKVNFIYGIFHKPEILVSYQDRNPYVKVVSMSNIEVQNNVRKKKIGLGVSIGYSWELKPTVVVGLNYSILQF